MLLVALAARLPKAEQPRRVRTATSGPRPAWSLRAAFDLASEPQGNAELAARVVVLLGIAAVCYCLGNGARIFVEQAPLQAATMVAVAAIALGARRKG